MKSRLSMESRLAEPLSHVARCNVVIVSACGTTQGIDAALRWRWGRMARAHICCKGQQQQQELCYRYCSWGLSLSPV